MILYANDLRAQDHISGKTTFRIRLSDKGSFSSCPRQVGAELSQAEQAELP